MGKKRVSNRGKEKREIEPAIQDIKSETDVDLELLGLERSGSDTSPPKLEKARCSLCMELLADPNLLPSFPLHDRPSLENHSRKHSEQNGWSIEMAIQKCFPGHQTEGRKETEENARTNEHPNMRLIISPIDSEQIESKSSKRKLSLSDETLVHLGLQKAAKVDTSSPGGSISILSTTSMDGTFKFPTSSTSDFKITMSQLSKHVKSTDSGAELSCAYPDCSYRISRNDPYSASFHISSHCGKNLFRCLLCSYETSGRNKAQKHVRVKHPECKQPFEEVVADGSEENDQLLVTTLAQCYPVVQTLNFWHPDIPNSIGSKVKQCLEKFRSPQDCQDLQSCCYPHVDSEIGIFQHLTIAHFEQNLFICMSCQYTGNDIWKHVYTEHKTKRHGKMFQLETEPCITELGAFFDKYLAEPQPPAKLKSPTVPMKTGKKKSILRKLRSTPIPPPENLLSPTTIGSSFLESVFEGIGDTKMNRSFNLNSTLHSETQQNYSLRDRSSLGRSTLKGDNDKGLKYPPAFMLRQQLLSRLSRQKDDAKFKCHIPECKFFFTYKNGRLGNHILSHTGKRLFSCMICTKKETNRDTIYSHFTKVHPDTHHQGQIIDNSWAHDDLLVKLCHRGFPMLDSLSNWFPETPAEIYDLLLTFLKLSACNENWQLGCCQEKVALSEIGVYRHVVEHFTKPLFTCFFCSYQGQDIYEHVSKDHFFAGKCLFEDHQSEVKDQLIEHFRFCLSMEDEISPAPQVKGSRRKSKNLTSSSKSKNSSDLEETPKLKPGTLTRRINLLKAEIKKAEDSRKFYCSYPNCGRQLTEHCVVVAHLANHIGKSLYQCSACGCRSNYNSYPRHSEKHPDLEGKFIERTNEFEPQLNNCLDVCFPIVAEIEFWQKFYPEDRDDVSTKFDERIYEIKLENQGKSLICKLCDLEIPRKGNFHSDIDLRSHIFSHVSVHNLFECRICGEETSRIWNHHVSSHPGKAYDFDDRQTQYDDVLYSLAGECFDL